MKDDSTAHVWHNFLRDMRKLDNTNEERRFNLIEKLIGSYLKDQREAPPT